MKPKYSRDDSFRKMKTGAMMKSHASATLKFANRKIFDSDPYVSSTLTAIQRGIQLSAAAVAGAAADFARAGSAEAVDAIRRPMPGNGTASRDRAVPRNARCHDSLGTGGTATPRRTRDAIRALSPNRPNRSIAFSCGTDATGPERRPRG